MSVVFIDGYGRIWEWVAGEPSPVCIRDIVPSVTEMVESLRSELDLTDADVEMLANMKVKV